jgi:hypothetical protein
MSEVTNKDFFERFLLLPFDKKYVPLDFGRHNLLTMNGIVDILHAIDEKMTPLELEREKWLKIAAEYLPLLESPL